VKWDGGGGGDRRGEILYGFILGEDCEDVFCVSGADWLKTKDGNDEPDCGAAGGGGCGCEVVFWVSGADRFKRKDGNDEPDCDGGGGGWGPCCWLICAGSLLDGGWPAGGCAGGGGGGGGGCCTYESGRPDVNIDCDWGFKSCCFSCFWCEG
jgi:hypothetical protein